MSKRPDPRPALAQVQSRMLRALLHGGDGADLPLRADAPGLPSTRRLRVHRHHIGETLTGALIAIHPVLVRLVGEACFRRVARSYVRAHPPRTGTLIEFGATLSRHLRRLDALAGLPYLPDVAALEWAVHVADHEAVEPPLELAALAALSPAQQGAIRLRLQPAARLVASRYPVLAIWRANQAGAGADAPAIALDDGGVRLLVVQHDLDVELRTLDAAELLWLRLLARQCTLSEATAAALARHPRFDLATALARHFGAGLFCGFTLGGRAGADHPAGSQASIVVPRPGADRTRIEPPSASTR